MADTKISALSATPAVVLADIVPVVQSATSKSAAFSVIKTLVNTAPSVPAGNASAGTWPVLATGSVLSVPVQGTEELEGVVPYFSVANSSRGVMVTEQWITNNSAYSLTSTTNAQKVFNNPANGALTVAASTSYFFEAMLSLSSMTVTSGNCAFDILGAGTATFTSAAWFSVGLDATTLTTAAALGGAFQANKSSVGDIITAGIGAGLFAHCKGIFRVNGAGTIIPSLRLTTAAVAIVGVNSFFKCYPIGKDTTVSIGHWN